MLTIQILMATYLSLRHIRLKSKDNVKPTVVAPRVLTSTELISTELISTELNANNTDELNSLDSAHRRVS